MIFSDRVDEKCWALVAAPLDRLLYHQQLPTMGAAISFFKYFCLSVPKAFVPDGQTAIFPLLEFLDPDALNSAVKVVAGAVVVLLVAGKNPSEQVSSIAATVAMSLTTTYLHKVHKRLWILLGYPDSPSKTILPTPSSVY
jgi:hypothetical protein